MLCVIPLVTADVVAPHVIVFVIVLAREPVEVVVVTDASVVVAIVSFVVVVAIASSVVVFVVRDAREREKSPTSKKTSEFLSTKECDAELSTGSKASRRSID